MDQTTDAAGSRHSHADVVTDNASRYLQQLCKHFSHKVEVTFDETAGHVIFSIGHCRLTAHAGLLRLALGAPDAEALSELEQVIERHLLRFAFRETLSIAWCRVHQVGADSHGAAPRLLPR
ncbi:MAG TPA: DUF2218 domain-containing protein [Bosea sp. (in: a-proteobacteria)]|jgi:hypothetical protein|uniref:DUF2218 domain-containing protein n=1 Tax=Bosea sp. (in: a-proteobacteria) TaxID=1871050 RepID=UPI002E14A7F5|nr:DUF2218 domain-containing protein [Bosea sp. (in: a-proteobacteria)]